MDIPEGIEKQILEYLHIEYGEDPNDDSSLKLQDIVYEDLYDIYGVPTHYWRYAPKGKRRWATVEPFGDSYVFGMTNKTPVPLAKSDLYKSLEIYSLGDQSLVASIPLEDWGSGCYGLSDYKMIRISSEEEIRVLTEVGAYTTPTSVTLSIEEEGRNIYIRGSIGLALSYTTSSGTKLSLTIGTGPWE